MAISRLNRCDCLLRLVASVLIASLLWLEVSPSYAANLHIRRENARIEAWRLAHPPTSELPTGLTQTPNAIVRRKIQSNQAKIAGKPVAEIRPLTAAEMSSIIGRGPLRNPYLSGTLPWQRSFHDVNLSTGNLFKNFTDIQVAPARGSGLVLQRIYNSNDARIGPFGIGWTDAYDMRIQEATDVQAETGNSTAVSLQPVVGQTQPGGADLINEVPRTDYCGGKHTYHRDADGLYSPPEYMYDEMNSSYNIALVNGPAKIDSDSEKGIDGTVKHYTNVLTQADGSSGNERACDSITDRYGNSTILSYGLSYIQSDGSTLKLLTQVTDPTGKTLIFHWNNFGTTSQPAYRIIEVDAPTDQITRSYSYRVTYDYYLSASTPGSGGIPFQLKSVHIDPDNLNRTTTYTYTSFTGSYTDQSGNQQTTTENGLLQSIIDPLGNTTSYSYALSYIYNNGQSTYPEPTPTGSLWIRQITEPAGVDINNAQRNLTWTIMWTINNPVVFVQVFSPTNSQTNTYPVTAPIQIQVTLDQNLRTISDGTNGGNAGNWEQYLITYDNSNNTTEFDTHEPRVNELGNLYRRDTYSYGPHGNVLSHSVTGWSPSETTTYYDSSQYFQRASQTDMNGHITNIGIGTNMAGFLGDPDVNPGDRGQILWVRDAGYNDPSSPSYHKQSSYAYNQYGQKISEINTNGTITQYTYGVSGNDLGFLVQIVQDAGGAGHLNRTTLMHYDIMGHVLQSTSPSGLTTSYTYNSLGQPITISAPARGSILGETISYSYDNNGRTHTVTDARGATTMNYELGSDRLSSVSDPITGTVSYTYLITGERQTMTLPKGETWTYAYQESSASNPAYINNSFVNNCVMSKDDPNSVQMALTSISDGQGRKSFFELFHGGQMLATSTDISYNTSGAVVGYCSTISVYDSMGSNLQPTNSHGWLNQISTNWNWVDTSGQWHSSPLSKNSYGFDNTGLRQSNQITNNSGSSRTEQYSYDNLNRLKMVDYGDGQTQSYTFDAIGNRTQLQDSNAGAITYGYDAANRLTTLNGNTNAFTNDGDGNTLTGNGRINSWDSQNRLVSSTINGVTSSYTYGADGVRHSATANGVTTYYVYDGSLLVQEMKLNAQNQLTPSATYINGASGPEYRRDDGTFGTPVRWYIYDGLGSVVGELDPVGNVMASAKYDVYGAKRTGGAGTASSRQGFVGSLGHMTDTETGLVYMQARYYDSNLGRFISEDPSGNGNNWFIYASASPASSVDPDGKTNYWIEDGASIIACAYMFAALNSSGGAAGYARAVDYGLKACGWFGVAIAFGASETTPLSLGEAGSIICLAQTYAKTIVSMISATQVAKNLGIGELQVVLYAACAEGMVLIGEMSSQDAGY